MVLFNGSFNLVQPFRQFDILAWIHITCSSCRWWNRTVLYATMPSSGGQWYCREAPSSTWHV